VTCTRVNVIAIRCRVHELTRLDEDPHLWHFSLPKRHIQTPPAIYQTVSPGTSVNKGKKKGRGEMLQPFRQPTALCSHAPHDDTRDQDKDRALGH
jgi:hypothetical protein